MDVGDLKWKSCEVAASAEPTSMRFRINTNEDIAVHEDWKAERGIESLHPDAEVMGLKIVDGVGYGDGLDYGDEWGDGRGYGDDYWLDGDGSGKGEGNGAEGSGFGDGIGYGGGGGDGGFADRIWNTGSAGS